MVRPDTKKILIITITIVVIVVLASTIIFYIYFKNKNNDDNTANPPDTPPNDNNKNQDKSESDLTDENGIPYALNGCLNYYVANDKSFTNTNVPRTVYGTSSLNKCASLCDNINCNYASYDNVTGQCQIYNFLKYNDRNLTLFIKNQPKPACSSSTTNSTKNFDNSNISTVTKQIVPSIIAASNDDAISLCNASCNKNLCDGYYIYLDDTGNYICDQKFMSNTPGITTLISATS